MTFEEWWGGEAINLIGYHSACRADQDWWKKITRAAWEERGKETDALKRELAKIADAIAKISTP